METWEVKEIETAKNEAEKIVLTEENKELTLMFNERYGSFSLTGTRKAYFKCLESEIDDHTGITPATGNRTLKNYKQGKTFYGLKAFQTFIETVKMYS